MFSTFFTMNSNKVVEEIIMENMVERASIETPTIVDPECKTPTPPIEQQLHKPSNELRNLVSPVHLKLPKPFKYPERYTSPTDMMMSPVTKGLLARNKKKGAVLPPGVGKYQPKVPVMCLQDVKCEPFSKQASNAD